METNSDDENRNKTPSSSKKNSNTNDGQVKPKRQMKTPLQLETLEKAYAAENYPTEKMRAELSKKLNLSDRQLQMWFCHRRLKDKKESNSSAKENTQSSGKKQRKIEPLPDSPVEELRGVGPEAGSDYGSGSGSGSSEYLDHRRAGVDDAVVGRRYFDSSPQSVMELRAIACVEAQLGEPLREDGPILGMEFDPLPPDAFGAPIEAADQHRWSGYSYEGRTHERRDGRPSKASTRALQEYQFLQEQSNIRSDTYGHHSQSPHREPSVDTLRGRASPFLHGEESVSRVHASPSQMPRVRVLPQQEKKGPSFTSPHRDDNGLLPRESSVNNRNSVASSSQPFVGPENTDVLPSLQAFNNDDDVRMERKRKFDESKIAKEVEAHEIRIRKELEKQDILRRKTEERLRKEMERYDRERRKEEERLLREKQREEERSIREQKRELERREKFLQKEYLRAEKKRQKEELRREREAVKRKVAMEKASARKIAKESLDLIEDEQLELMELAAASKGTSSIANLDYDTLQNLEQFRDSLRKFPPESVQLKKPIALQPWVDSEENIGNLLMVWRFFITFADVLGLWPFTLAEFVQAFHDYDSRLLGELHVALLKLIIKDIEDVARTPSTGLGTNQYCVANPEGGHPQIVEGAYMWGFDIRNWQQHLNPLTWLEIFRQLALSAGFGPRLKRRSAAWSLLDDNDKLKGGDDAISNLRNGSAAENAFALMRERGLLAPRRSRHRLTPGTVKFAAFHVLSLEGSKGLTVLELADKIQKSGLRDLTTSKTPEASISVALTRDQKLFERIAPSTYCVRAAYRKDPADAEAVIAAARKKIQVFENGFLGGEDADDVEREEDSEGEVDEDPEVDDMSTPLTINKVADPSNEVNICSGSGKDNPRNDAPLVQEKSKKEVVSLHVNGPKDANAAKTGVAEQTVASGGVGTSNAGQEDFEIDESKSGESWIQGLTEGEYSYLSVEERLHALVALVGFANEGNSVRAVLEERLEAANALKKQMWAEAQLDRSRLKEDIVSKLNFSSFIGGKTEAQFASSAMEDSQSPLLFVDGKKEASPSAAEDQKSLLAAENVQSDLNNATNEKTLNGQDPSVYPDNLSSQQQGITSKRLRSQFKAYVAHMAEETYVYRSLPLGQDRRRNRYWQFVASASRNDPCSGRIFVELREGKWRVIDSEEAFDAIVSSLDLRGVRESHLRIMLQKIENSFKENVRRNRNLKSENSVCQSGTSVKIEAIETESSPNSSAGTDSPDGVVCGSNTDILGTCSLFQIELGRSDREKKNALRRYQDFQRWMWKECFNTAKLSGMRYGKKRSMQLLATCDLCFDSYPSEEMHCISCHQTFDTTRDNLDFSAHEIECEEKRMLEPKTFYSFDSSLPLAIKLLKAQLAAIEVSVPQEALESFWTENYRKEWAMKLAMSSSAEELMQLLTVFESAIKRERLSSTFEMTKELLSSTGGSARVTADVAHIESVPVLPWIPKTLSAVALRLFELDASIIYVPREKAQPSEDKPIKIHMKLPPKYSPLKNKEAELKELKQPERPKGESFSELRGKRNNSKRGKGGRNQGYSIKLQSKVPTLKTDTSRRNNKETGHLSQALRQQGQKTDVQASSWGRRTVRKRRAEKMVADDTLFTRSNSSIGSKNYGGPLRKSGSEEWRFEKRSIDMDIGDNNNSMDEAESDDNDEPEGYEQGNWRHGFGGSTNGWNVNQMQESEDDASGDDNGVEAMEDDDSDGDADLSDGSEGGAANKMQIDEDLESADSEDYSD